MAGSKKDHKKEPLDTITVKTKNRKNFAPKTKKHEPKKGKGSFKRKDTETLEENIIIRDLISAITEEKYADAAKYLNQVLELKMAKRIQAETPTALF